jgi:iron complex outermembrane receptor protein
MKRNILHIISLFIFLQVGWINILCADTIPIPEVIIQSSRETYFSSTNLNYKLDSFQSHYYGRNSIADVLQNFTPAQINSYGLGGAVSISLRGTADDQTAVYWNGLKINSITLGSADISLIPINAANNIDIITNASGAALGSGTFGGAVLLNNKPTFQRKLKLSIRQDFSSFKNYRTNFSLKIGNEKIQFSSSSFYQNAKNNFPFYDKYKFENPLVLNEHNDLKQWATVNELNVKLKKQQQLDIGNFTLSKFHNVPALMGGYKNSVQYQKDFSVKSFMRYQKIFSNAQLYFRTGHVYDYLYYNDEASNIKAPYFAHQLQNSLNYRHYFKHSITMDAGLDYIWENAKVTAYNIIANRHRGAAFIGTKYIIKNIELSATVRQEIMKSKYIRPQFGLVIAYTDKKNIFNTSFSYADKYRLPDFNDLFWQPGGNKNLLPESGYTVEYNLNIHPLKKSSPYQLNFSNSIYYSIINNNIVWSPILSGLYTPQNIKKTRHYGIESTLENSIRWNKTNLFKVSINYNYNHSTIIKEASNPALNGHFIRYRPQHTIKSYFIFEDKYFNTGCNILYVSSRFTDDENIKVFQLKPYTLVDLFVAFNGYFKMADAEIAFKVNNISNTKYESLRSYAQPLRNYTISILLNLKTNLK